VRIAIRMLDAPTKGTGAFMPTLTPGPSAITGGLTSRAVTFYPGGLPTPSPAPAALNDGMLGGPLNQPSRCAPDVFMPAIGIPRPVPQVLGRGNDNPIPVKAPWTVGIPGQTQYRPRIGGLTATAWPRQLVLYPTYGGAP